MRINRKTILILCTRALSIIALVALASACDIPWLLTPEATITHTQQPTEIHTTLTSTPTPPVWISVYFSDPEDPESGSLRGGPDQALAEAIAQARLTIDVAIYDLNLWSIRDALLAAHQRGVDVRVVTESDNLDEMEIQEISDSGILVLGDRREGLMHHKFVIIDRLEVWTGSMNFTLNGAYSNDNCLIRIRSSQLAENYLTEFEEMYVSDYFGTDSLQNTPNEQFSHDGILMESYFSPDDQVANRILELIGNARESIAFMVFSFTSEDIAHALIERVGAGVLVSGVIEEGQYISSTYSQYDVLRGGGVDIRLDGNFRNMHHKMIIIDDEIVITGSYNFSNSAETRNDENIVVIHNGYIAAEFLDEFERVYEQAED